VIATPATFFFETHQGNKIMNQPCTLATLRDVFLPKLLTGELRVAIAKEEVAR
jgi:hypothetical protein